MNDVQLLLANLKEEGWTLSAIADEMGVSRNAVDRWRSGSRYPDNAKAVVRMLEDLSQHRAPKKRRYRGENVA